MLVAVWIFGFIYIVAMIIVIIWTRGRNKEPGDKAPKTKQKPLSEELKAQREAHGMSLETVAKSVHSTPEMVASWEEGKAVPGTSGLFALAELYGISMDELTSGEQPQ